MLNKCKNHGLFIVFFFFFVQLIHAQDRKLADSLIVEYNKRNLTGIERLELLRNLSFNLSSDLEESLKYSNELIELALKDENFLYLYRGYSQKGQSYLLAGDLPKALDAFVKSSEAASKVEDKSYEGGAYLKIADVYSGIGNSANAESYYSKSIGILRLTTDTLTLASALLNAGDEAFLTKNYDKALDYFEESGLLFKKVNYPIGIAYNLGNVGMVYAEQGLDSLAEEYINEAMVLLEESEDFYPITVYLTYMSDIYLRRKDFSAALNYAQRSLDLAKQYRLKEQISEANLTLSKLFEISGNHDISLKHYKDHISYRDSIINLENIQQIADLRTDFEVSQKQIEVDLLEQKRKNQLILTFTIAIALFFIGILALLWYRRYLFIKKTNRIIEEERDRSDRLLLNILPEDTATELKLSGKVKTKKHDIVTVLFTDFKGFTSYSENLSPERLVETVDFYFSKFDEIIEKHGLEKIKTIGDAYMCASGLYGNKEDHAHKMILAAKEIVAFVEETKNDIAVNELTFDIRIGINSGPVVAGVVGSKKFAYDIWGDTVNVASRMESMSEPGKINISERTYELIKDDWSCEYRGEIDVKNRGKLKMYFLML
ncbi:adenylate/guanylate cyclase domain-containing protein [Shivajiella indica]|uniref:Adenylate/guanylate cyclase domain-containing protein n=1 Tax=Shivajiella indica TaxID=872115 RepID=A0ABW5BB45_9BACT